MSLLGNNPETKKYNLVILIFAALGIIFVGAMLSRSIILIILCAILLLLVAPILAITKSEYWSFLWKKASKKYDAKYEFDRIYERYERFISCKKQIKVSPQLKGLLRNLYSECLKDAIDSGLLKSALYKLFVFITSPEGRTSANCWMVNTFVGDYDDKWRPNLPHLPEQYIDVFHEIEFLHGAVEEPEYHTAPEEILAMIDKLSDQQTED